MGLAGRKYRAWKTRYGKANEHNALVPRDWWLDEGEKAAILQFHDQHPLEGYRRLTYMMLDANVVAVSASTVYRILKEHGRLGRRGFSPSKKGTGFVQPLGPHQHWHIDVSYINIAGTFYYLCSVLDGCSRFITHWDLREKMTTDDVLVILQAAREKYPDVKPRIISDNGPQFIARDFKQFIRLTGMTHVRTSPFYPQSNGKLERWHGSIKRECIRPRTPLSLEDAQRLVTEYVHHYNHFRLHSSLGYVTPADKLAGREQQIHAARDQKLETAREKRRERRAEAKAAEARSTSNMAQSA